MSAPGSRSAVVPRPAAAGRTRLTDVERAERRADPAMTFRRRPTAFDTPLGDLIAGKIDQAEYRRRMLVETHVRYLDPDPLTVDPEPVHPVIRCSRCGDRLPFGRIGRCDDCRYRGGNPIGCVVVAIAFVAVVLVAVAVALAWGGAS